MDGHFLMLEYLIHMPHLTVNRAYLMQTYRKHECAKIRAYEECGREIEHGSSHVSLVMSLSGELENAAKLCPRRLASMLNTCLDELYTLLRPSLTSPLKTMYLQVPCASQHKVVGKNSTIILNVECSGPYISSTKGVTVMKYISSDSRKCPSINFCDVLLIPEVLDLPIVPHPIKKRREHSHSSVTVMMTLLTPYVGHSKKMKFFMEDTSKLQ